MWTLCICHLPSEDPQTSPPPSRGHQQAAGFLRKELFSYHLCLTAANKRKAYILKIVPEDSISLIYLGFLLFFCGEEDWSPKWEERDELKYTEAALRNYTIQKERKREKHYWKTKKDFGLLHFFTCLNKEPLSFTLTVLSSWWQPCCRMTRILQWSTFLCTRLWHPTSSNMCGSQEKLGLVIHFSSLGVKLQQLKFHSKVTSDSSLMAH